MSDNDKHPITVREVIMLRKLNADRALLDDFVCGVLDGRIRAFKRFGCRTMVSNKQSKILSAATSLLQYKEPIS